MTRVSCASPPFISLLDGRYIALRPVYPV